MSPKEITKVDITTEVFKEPIEVIKKLTAHLEGLKYTKVIQTFVMEDRRLNYHTKLYLVSLSFRTIVL